MRCIPLEAVYMSSSARGRFVPLFSTVAGDEWYLGCLARFSSCARHSFSHEWKRRCMNHGD